MNDDPSLRTIHTCNQVSLVGRVRTAVPLDGTLHLSLRTSRHSMALDGTWTEAHDDHYVVVNRWSGDSRSWVGALVSVEGSLGTNDRGRVVVTVQSDRAQILMPAAAR